MNLKDKKNRIILTLAIVGVILVGTGIFLGLSLMKSAERVEELKEVEDYIALEKEQMLNDLKTTKQQYDELKMSINNDSLLYKLELEQKRTQELLEELERTKATDAAEIKRLKKELKVLREVLASYVVQIDSLHRENTALKDENKTLQAGKKKVEKERDTLVEEKEQLTEKVTLASQLDATDVRLMLLRKNGKQTEKIKRAKQIKTSFTISKNITASTGEKIAYARITNGDQELLTKNRRETFPYEGREIGYSMKMPFEFTGEEITLTMYWDIEEKLSEGIYNVSIFVDGNMIGSGSAEFE